MAKKPNPTAVRAPRPVSDLATNFLRVYGGAVADTLGAPADLLYPAANAGLRKLGVKYQLPVGTIAGSVKQPVDTLNKVARFGAGFLVPGAPAAKGAKLAVKEGVDRLAMSHKAVTKRIPELTAGAQALSRGELTSAEYQALIDKYKPVLPYKQVPVPATHDEIRGAVNFPDRVGAISEYPEGRTVGLRLDIPAYTRHGVWAPTIHDNASPKTLKNAHEPAAHVTNATFNIPQSTSLKIAAGGEKSPFAVVKGALQKTPTDDIYAMAQKYLSDPDWRQVGMDPERHGFFYDRVTQEPIVSAEEVIQVGPLVLAKKPVYGNVGDFKYEYGGLVAKYGVEGYAKGGHVAKYGYQTGGPAIPGNIDLHNRPVVHNADDSISTVLSTTVGFDDKTYVLPRVVDGKIVSVPEAIEHFRRTGEHLGAYDKQDDAEKYSQSLHEEQAEEYKGKAMGGLAEKYGVEGYAKGGAKKPTDIELAVQKVTGMKPGLDRASILPFYTDKSGRNHPSAPQFLYDAAKAFVVPGVAAQGGKYDTGDVVNMAMNVTGGGLGASHVAGPTVRAGEQVLGMGVKPKGAGKTAVKEVEKLAAKYGVAASPSVGLRGADKPLMISTRRPSAPNYATQGDPDVDLLIQSGEALRANPAAFTKNMQMLAEEPFMAHAGTTDPDLLYKYGVRQGAENLKFITNELMPVSQVESAKPWYETAQKVSERAAANVGLPPEAGYGVTAVLSPQTPWDINVGKMERLMRMYSSDFATDPDDVMKWAAARRAAAKKPADVGAVASYPEAWLRRVAETPMADLPVNSFDRYAKVVMADATQNDPMVKRLLPTGEYGGDYGSITWGSGTEINKALNILSNPSMANIRSQMEGGGKVPSFYNNIAAPTSTVPISTIDTHSAGAASLFPGGGNDPIVYRAMGLGAKPGLPPAAASSATTGAKGLYGPLSDMHTLAGQELGFLPRETQSVTWEGVRDLWGQSGKTPELKRDIADIHRKASSPDEARFAVAERLGRPVRRVFAAKPVIKKKGK